MNDTAKIQEAAACCRNAAIECAEIRERILQAAEPVKLFDAGMHLECAVLHLARSVGNLHTLADKLYHLDGGADNDSE